MKYFSIKDWEKHQHYKDRNPPWIKLYKEVIDDYDITCLQDASRLLQMLLWILASQMNNRIPFDIEWLQKRLNLNTKPNLNELIDKGFIIPDSDMLAERKRIDIPETETYREETEKEKKEIYTNDFLEFWKTYPKNNGTKFSAFEKYKRAIKGGINHETIIAGARAYEEYTRGKPIEYTKHAATWLNHHGWESELTAGVQIQPKSKITWTSAAEQLIAKDRAKRERDRAVHTSIEPIVYTIETVREEA